MVRKYIIDSLKYWVEEYGVDGFRFDLMALIDFETMREVEVELRKIKPNIVIYGEPWSSGHSPIKGQRPIRMPYAIRLLVHSMIIFAMHWAEARTVRNWVSCKMEHIVRGLPLGLKAVTGIGLRSPPRRSIT